MAETPTIPQKYQNLKTQLANLISKETTTKEDKNNKVTSWSSTTTDTNYPSEKLTKDTIDNKVDKSTKIASGSNLNNYTTTGFYYNNVNTESANISNLAESGQSFFLIVEDWGTNNYTKQTITHYGTNKTYTRIRNAGTWGTWCQLAKGGNFEYVVGTQGTSATATWTGTCSNLTQITDGTVIYYYLPSSTSGISNVTLNLTLANGTTTGAKNCYFKGTTRLATQYPINTLIGLVYTTQRDSGCWYVISPNDNNSWNMYEYGGVQIGAGESIATTILCGAKADGKYYKLANGVILDTSYPIIYTNTSYTTSTTNSNNLYNKRYDVNVTNTKSITLTAPKPVYVEGSAYSDGKFTISSNVITQTLTSGKYYWLIGFAYSDTNIRFDGTDKTIYYYDGNNLKKANENHTHSTDEIQGALLDVSGTSLSAWISQGATQSDLNEAIAYMFDHIYPVGAIYISTNSTNPSSVFGGTWVQIKDTFLLACGDTYSNGATGGEATHSLTQSEMPRHTHTQNAHSHEPSNTDFSFLASNGNIAVNGTKRALPSTNTSGVYFVYNSDDTAHGINEYTNTSSVTATNKYTGGSGSSESASNGSAHNNMPPYVAVYVWKRTA